jgi:hypothetical protein
MPLLLKYLTDVVTSRFNLQLKVGSVRSNKQPKRIVLVSVGFLLFVRCSSRFLNFIVGHDCGRCLKM